MMIKIAAFIFFVLLYLQNVPNIVGEWKLVSYDAIEKIRLSPAYAYGEKDARDQIDKQFEVILSEGQYNFTEMELNYTDLEGSNIIYRRANYTIDNDTLLISEIDRNYQRKAYIKFLSSDSLVLSPIIDNKISDSKLIFNKK